MRPIIVPKFFSEERTKELYSYFLVQDKLKQTGIAKRQALIENDFFLDVNRGLEEGVSKLLNKLVKTSYNYICEYEKGTSLKPHLDKKECQYTISVPIGCEPNIPTTTWPLFVLFNTEIITVSLDIGDAILYTGVDYLHWRKPMPVEFQSVTMGLFHFV